MIPGETFSKLRDYLIEITTKNHDSMHYFRRRWNETKLGESEEWGFSYWYFEVAPDGTVTRQMEVYDNGTILRYHAHHIEDQYGSLAEKPIDHREFHPYSISRSEFEESWASQTI